MHPHLLVESPDNHAVVDFAGDGDDKHRACSVQLTVEKGKIHVLVLGCDDRSTILIDSMASIPKEDTRE